MGRAEAAVSICVSVACSPRAGVVDTVELRLAAGATVADALAASGLRSRHPELAWETLPVGIWGALCRRDVALRDRDRVEVYRGLQVDPKEARRQRQRAQARPRR